MGWFKRLCLFVFGLAGILALVALSLPWVGPYTREASSLITGVPEYFTVLEALVCITGLGCLICFLRSLFTPRNRKEIIISDEGGDQITVTRAAIASQAEHIVERDGSCVAGTVRVNARKRGNIKVFVRVTPKRSLDVVKKGEQLHAELDEGLAQIAADKVRSVNLEFTDPQEMDDVSTSSTSDASTCLSTLDDGLSSYDYDIDSPSPVVDDDEDENDHATSAVGDSGVGAGGGITVSMSSFHHSDAGTTEASTGSSADDVDTEAPASADEDASQDPTTSLDREALQAAGSTEDEEE